MRVPIGEEWEWQDDISSLLGQASTNDIGYLLGTGVLVCNSWKGGGVGHRGGRKKNYV